MFSWHNVKLKNGAWQAGVRADVLRIPVVTHAENEVCCEAISVWVGVGSEVRFTSHCCQADTYSHQF